MLLHPTQPLNYAEYTASGTAQKLTIPASFLLSQAFISVETADIRFRYDGTAPTTTVGHRLSAGQSLRLEGAISVKNFQFIAVSGSPVVRVTLENRA